MRSRIEGRRLAHLWLWYGGEDRKESNVHVYWAVRRVTPRYMLLVPRSELPHLVTDVFTGRRRYALLRFDDRKHEED